ncbi:hypothetical protein TELCIR_11711 [Teladorsagia circumcincta]|uniref:Uncharacterized protein n=1 Tax=Teladorsagia circumcincta TaxID=45464 RepID=A0A2G9U8J3_TELCI|nr:hypothetical protein TELCIR_11711 [Teladorsagia circumcincta]
MVVMWLGPLPVVMLYSPRLAEKILTSSKHLSKGFAYGYLEAWLGQGIITRLVNYICQRKHEYLGPVSKQSNSRFGAAVAN